MIDVVYQSIVGLPFFEYEADDRQLKVDLRGGIQTLFQLKQKQ